MIDSWNIRLQSFSPEHDHIFGVCRDGNERATSGLWSYLWAHYDASFLYRSSHYRLTQTAINNRKSLILNHPPDMELLLASGLYGYKSFKNVPHEFAIMGGTRQFGESWCGYRRGMGCWMRPDPQSSLESNRVGQRLQIEMDYSNWLWWDCKEHSKSWAAVFMGVRRCACLLVMYVWP